MLFETTRFTVEKGILANDPEPQYLVKNKETEIVEFCNASLYFARDWAVQFTQALDQQEQEWKDKDTEKLLAAVTEAPTGGKPN